MNTCVTEIGGSSNLAAPRKRNIRLLFAPSGSNKTRKARISQDNTLGSVGGIGAQQGLGHLRCQGQQCIEDTVFGFPSVPTVSQSCIQQVVDKGSSLFKNTAPKRNKVKRKKVIVEPIPDPPTDVFEGARDPMRIRSQRQKRMREDNEIEKPTGGTLRRSNRTIKPTYGSSTSNYIVDFEDLDVDEGYRQQPKSQLISDVEHEVRDQQRNLSASIIQSCEPPQPSSIPFALPADVMNRTDIGQAHFQRRRRVRKCGYSDLGDMDCVCMDCGAMFWKDESKKSVRKGDPFVYTRCCKEGRVQLDDDYPTPAFLEELLDPTNGSQSRSFRDNIRSYNCMFAFTSIGANVDKSINEGSGPYVFKISS